jgi:hypothetical protein
VATVEALMASAEFERVEAAWRPVRWVSRPQVCESWCWEVIPAGKPGARVGERGTKAYYNPVIRMWRCLRCQEEATRADEARARNLAGTP